MSAPYFIYTSTVEGQFQKAGFEAAKIVETHGSIQYLQCLDNCTDDIWPAGGVRLNLDKNYPYVCSEMWPKCPYCGGTARPNVLMHDDDGWLRTRVDVQEKRMSAWLRGAGPKAVIEIGVGANDLEIRDFAERAAEKSGTKVVRINPDGGLGDAKVVLPVLQKQVDMRGEYHDFSTYGRAV